MKRSKKTKVVAFNCPNCGAAVDPDSTTCCYCGSAIMAGVCSSCFGPVSIRMKHCPTCGADVEITAPEKVTKLQCPQCLINLSLIRVGGRPLHECMRCGGLWIDKASFQAICRDQEEQEAVLEFQSGAEVPSTARKGKSRRAYVPCPECGKLMNHENFAGCSGIVLDWCRDHGSWFDKREVQQIATFIRKGGLKKARKRERTQLQLEKQRLRMQQFELIVRAGRFSGS